MVDFVSNRIKEISRISSPENWRHVPGRMNPADVLSRGCSPRHLLEILKVRSKETFTTFDTCNVHDEQCIPDVTDLDLSDFVRFQKRVKFRARLLKDLRGRFRKEYLGLLVQKAHKTTRVLKGRKSTHPKADAVIPRSSVLSKEFPLEIQPAEMGESNDVHWMLKPLKFLLLALMSQKVQYL
ncbi:hypothetical protein TNCV_4424761 [Trichonephila clavipes]|nr:hypothetical protein TNCV_4424761 [Trichonephila clavipes]